MPSHSRNAANKHHCGLSLYMAWMSPIVNAYINHAYMPYETTVAGGDESVNQTSSCILVIAHMVLHVSLTGAGHLYYHRVSLMGNAGLDDTDGNLSCALVLYTNCI